MENLLPKPWLQELAREMQALLGGKPAVLNSRWRSPALDLPAYQTLLANGLRPPYISVLRGGSSIAVSEFTRAQEVMGHSTAHVADPTALVELLEQGDTVVLPQLDHWHAEIAETTRQLAHLFQRKVDAFLFATKTGAQGLNVHRDDADVLVVQLFGAKSWQIHGGPDHDDWAPGAVSDPGPVLLNTDLSAGQCLYVPRGFAHTARGCDSLSIHLSFTIREVGTKHLIQALQDALTADLPLPARPLTEESLSLTAQKLVQIAGDRLGTITPEQLLSVARASLLAKTSTHAVPRPPAVS